MELFHCCGLFLHIFMCQNPIVNTILEFIGKHSMNISMSTYFLETIIAIILFILLRISFLIATILFLLSLVTSYGIEWAKKAVNMIMYGKSLKIKF